MWRTNYELNVGQNVSHRIGQQKAYRASGIQSKSAHLPVQSLTARVLKLHQEQLALETLYPFVLHGLMPCEKQRPTSKGGGTLHLAP